MLQQEPWTDDQVEELFSTIARKQDAYMHIFPFFKAFFILKEEALRVCRPKPIALDTDTLTSRYKAGLPLIDRSVMPVDQANAEKLILDMLNLADESNEQLGKAARTMRASLASQPDLLRHCYHLLLDEKTGELKTQAQILGVSTDILLFFQYHSVWPSAAKHLGGLKRHLPGESEWRQGYCPFCGGQPHLSLLSRDGQRYLTCSFCTHVWSVRRIFCPFCENESAESLGYFYSEAEPQYRVHTCRKCQGYIKTVDLRQLNRPFYAPLETLVTTHLDIQALEQGFECKTPAWAIL